MPEKNKILLILLILSKTMMNTQENTNPTQDLWAILNQEYQQALAEAQQYLQWYEKYRTGKRKASRLLRGLAIAAVAVGTLCPLIDAAWKSPAYALGQGGMSRWL